MLIRDIFRTATNVNKCDFGFARSRIRLTRDGTMADFNFTNAYAVITSVTPAGKEQNSECINLSAPLGGPITIDDSNNLSQYFSGNDVCAIGLNIGGTTYYGWISRPIKVGGQV